MPAREDFYYLESAPQVVSAYRHIRQKGGRSFRMLVRLNGSPHNDQQISRVLELLGVRALGDVEVRRAGFRFFVHLLRCLLLGSYGNFCLADIRSTTGLAAATIARSERIVLLDDGVASIDYYRRRVMGLAPIHGGIVKRLIAPLANRRTRRMTLHTILPLKSASGMEIEPSTYQIGSGADPSQAVVDTGAAAFIGSKAVEIGACSAQYFRETLARFSARCSDLKLVYILHREEDAAKLAEFPEFELLRLELPLELEFGVGRPLPAVVGGFYSAALLNFIPYGERLTVVAYGLPIEPGNARFHHSIQASRFLFQDILGLRADS